MNLPVPQGLVEVEKKYENTSFDIYGLEKDTEYIVYIAGGSVHPGYPDLMPDSEIKTISLKTNLIIKLRLDISGGEVVKSCIGILVFLWILID